ncbi:MAG: hypothetical protein AABX75_00355 [Nanoarchaeota archaeon]
MTEHEINWPYYISWLGVAIIIVWIILKAAGVIHSPPWQELAPYFGAAVAFGGMISTIKQHGDDISDLKHEIKEVHNSMIHLDKEIEIIKDRQVR